MFTSLKHFWGKKAPVPSRPPALITIDFGNSGITVEAYLEKDGNAWCVSIGPNPHEGVQGFGPTIHEALVAFKDDFRNT